MGSVSYDIEAFSASESPGIGVYAESTLHAAVKTLWCGPGDRQEVRIAGRIVDILRADGEVVEVQTGNFGKLRDKVRALSALGYRVCVVHPVALKKYILRVDPQDGQILSRRKSPKSGSLLSLFDELIHFPDLLSLPGVRLEVLLVEVEEVRCPDGRGSWRRKFHSIVDRKISGAGEVRSFSDPQDLLGLLPPGIPSQFTAAELAIASGCPVVLARRLLWCLRAQGLAGEVGKRGRSLLWVLK